MAKSTLISDRAFGSDIFGPIKETLSARQSGSTIPSEGDSVQFANYKTNLSVPPGTNLDLSARKSWARMWTVVRSYSVGDNNKKNYDGSRVSLYEIGNNIYDDYNLHNHSAGSEKIGVLDKAVPDGMNVWNEYNKPSAGITGIQSSTQGDYGVYIETVVNFRVYNFWDYSNVVSKFFLHPGARVFVDMGWDTSTAYDQSQYFTIDAVNPLDADANYHKMHDDIFDGLYAVQFFQAEPGVAEFRYIPSSKFHSSHLDHIEKGIMRKLGDDFRLVMREVDEVEKTPGGKHTWLVNRL